MTETIEEFLNAGAETPRTTEPEWTLKLSDVDLVNAHADVEAHIDAINEKLRPARERKALIESILLKRLTDRGATVLAHPEFEVIVERKQSSDVLASELTPLFKMAVEGAIDQKDLDKAARWETPPPELKTHLTYLKQLGKKYGAPVLAILDKAIRVTAGAPKLVIAPKEREQKKITAA